MLFRLPIFILCLFIFACSGEQINESTLIAVQPFGNFAAEDAKEVEKSLRDLYKCRLVILEKIPLPKSAFINVKSRRYRADSLIRFLRRTGGEKHDFIIGLTAKDISTTKYSDWAAKTIKKPEYKYKDWGIFGLGFRPGKSCVVSVFRLKRGVGQQKFLERLRKITGHEIGHNLGLRHCPDKTCIMQDAAETIKTIDKVEFRLCALCRKKSGVSGSFKEENK